MGLSEKRSPQHSLLNEQEKMAPAIIFYPSQYVGRQATNILLNKYSLC